MIGEKLFTVTVPTKSYLDAIVKDLSRIRQWIEGFEAGGKKGPQHADGLRRAQLILDSAKASGIETGGQDAERLGAQHESPTLEERDAQTPIPSSRERK